MLTLPPGFSVRHTHESDHPAIVDAIGRWWDAPNRATLAMMLPRLYLQHFAGTSWIVESEAGEIGAFLVAFRSQDHPHIGYIHFIGVDPELRRSGIASGLYEQAFAQFAELGCTEVRAVTGPWNKRSQEFHTALGFVGHGDRGIDGVLAYPDYDGPGEHRVLFVRPL